MGDASVVQTFNWGTTTPRTTTVTHADAECTMQCGAEKTQNHEMDYGPPREVLENRHSGYSS